MLIFPIGMRKIGHVKNKIKNISKKSLTRKLFFSKKLFFLTCAYLLPEAEKHRRRK